MLDLDVLFVYIIALQCKTIYFILIYICITQVVIIAKYLAFIYLFNYTTYNKVTKIE